MALVNIQVPDIGDFDEVGVIELLVKVGDTVKAEQSLITVESDKASMEIPSSHAGVVKELKIALGDKVKQGSVIAVVESADAGAAAPSASVSSSASDALRVAYRDELLTTVVRDLVHGARVDDIAEELADLADAALEAGLAIARGELPPDAAPCRLSVIAMGKCGGRELNYVSDVDVIFVAEPVEGGDEEAALRTAQRLAAGVETLQGGDAQVPVVISADKGVKYETVVSVMDRLQRAGVGSVGLSVQTTR